MSRHRTVVIAIDDSFHSEFAFDFYVDNVHRQGDRIVLVHVPEYSNVLSTSSLLTDPNIVSDLLKDNEEKVRDLVEKYSMKMKECHLSGHVKQQCGKPGEAIIEAAKEEGASMLILGTRGMGLIRRTFTGSVSDYCLHHSDIPVLVCRHKSHIKHTCEHQP
ncbi:universal stress protein in QAH/OAS sulfhydrylase 3'region-like [Mercenaria mercenaria]|uniref:universal stress protein in QAH/OAS sulfhydrylase 3'region-like n=1 Tax=Mercenaria mercenaria TaxID=6596 RepID=UPI00234E6577|nr:universal stress protein in QAH/OAS sulfhydrylase 3'region-like [Mercenaria mercenaria]XP_053375611.1 universal stress protein in QAH/OAS sulfhydrylase 3'region-like [Mercenaria mercenaria]XP_053375612.1 universal stress protein in QAH/OAS sulfhydrylase 3'region-like [Mercenaria mercenaria]XP_053375613.1 universal stress protein in QAH/OAS sulfhydrylase 3'region-like [Mercenaria mercenaria]